MKHRLAWIAAIPLLSCTLVLGPDRSTGSRAIFDEMWTEFDRHYAFFEAKGIDWEAVRAKYSPTLEHATTVALIDTIRVVLALLDDPHVDVYPGHGQVLTSATARITVPTRFSPAIVTRYGSAFQATAHMRFGRLSPSIGYVSIPSFVGSGWGSEIDIALRGLDNISGLVIDIRDDGGGNDGNGVEIAGRFTDQRRLFVYNRYRSGLRHSDFTDFAPYYIKPIGTRFTGAIAVLTNRRVASSSESFVLMMRTIPGVTFIGDTTMGALSNPLERELSNGWLMRLSETLNYTPAKQMFEGVGLAPDIVVKATAADSSAGVDRALERAIQLLSGM